MGELAVGPVDLAPLVEYGQDLSDLLVEQAMQRAAARTAIVELVCGQAPEPPVGPHRAKLQHLAGRAELERNCKPASTARSSRSSRPALVAASTLAGTRPLSPNALFPPPTAA